MEDSGMQFLKYEPMFWRVQSKLARDGYLIEPQDARDFIHDFYLEWDPLTQRYKPELGAFEPYLATAFYQFCRRRFFKQHKVRTQTADLEAAAELPALAPSVADAAELKEQLEQVRQVIDGFAHSEKAILQDYLGEQGYGERELAQMHGLSRYRLREVLAELVGRIALKLTEAPHDSGDARIVHGLWIEGRSPKAVAALCGMSTADVQAAKNRFSHALLSSIRESERPTPKRRKTMNPLLALLRQAILADDNTVALSELRQHAAQVKQALEEGEILFTDEEIGVIAEDAARLEEVYAALAETTELSAAEALAEGAIAQMRNDEHIQIGQAWQVLTDQLALERFDWEGKLAALRGSDANLIAHLREDPSVQAGGEAAEKLLPFGLTPAMLFDAFDGLRLLFDRIGRRAGASSTSTVTANTIPLDLPSGVRAAVPLDMVIAQVAGTLDLESGKADALTGWMWKLLALHPCIVDGYAFDSVRGGFIQLPDHATIQSLKRDDLARRWSRTGGSVDSALPAEKYALAI